MEQRRGGASIQQLAPLPSTNAIAVVAAAALAVVPAAAAAAWLAGVGVCGSSVWFGTPPVAVYCCWCPSRCSFCFSSCCLLELEHRGSVRVRLVGGGPQLGVLPPGAGAGAGAGAG